MDILFWTSIGLVVYCYFGYPTFIYLIARIWNRRVDKKEYAPTVSVVLSVYNEEEVIEQKIHNLLTMDYPNKQIEFLIGSDGSTDRTNEMIKGFKDPRIQLIEEDQRRGKMATINMLVGHSQAEVILFTDARQIFAKDAIKKLVMNLADPKVGCVSGELIFSQKRGGTAKGINLYWDYEKFVRTQESRIHSMLGATGAIYAIKRALFTPIPENLILDDMYVPLHIVKRGFRAVVEDQAKAFDEVADSPREEHRRKTRTLYGNYQIFGQFLDMFIPIHSPVALQFFSHKLLRVLVPFILIGAFFSNYMLMHITVYKIIFVLQATFYVMAALGGLARHSKYGILNLISRICYVPYVFCLLNFSALVGFFRFVAGKQQVTWERAREAV